MRFAKQVRDRLIGFRVTADERTLLRERAASDDRNVTGFLRHLLAKNVVGFGSSNAPAQCHPHEDQR